MFLINILLVDDHALFSKSLEIALSDYSEIDAFDSINDVSQLDNFIVSKKPDIILMDINLKNISSEDGLELAKQILSCYPEQRVVILSGYDLPVYRSEARKIGAKGFVNKNIEPEKLISILSKIMQGILYFDREIPFIEGLTDSEKQIIQLIAEGQKRKDISSTLYINGQSDPAHQDTDGSCRRLPSFQSRYCQSAHRLLSAVPALRQPIPLYQKVCCRR